ncbi:hypothetical protein DERP_005819 [Dermatophagoides pteronyssinus]|uniref:Uncharacterized protein n=1 Tax=Dermatophagoides pteronyssinus TaxID=6956 RepID=A0ABQ8J9N7_DERPT|nr:hypothetical protein DERP_005819 [Dermatophagoides pteronyssinus]
MNSKLFFFNSNLKHKNVYNVECVFNLNGHNASVIHNIQLTIEDFHLFMLSMINNENDDEDLDSIIFMQHLFSSTVANGSLFGGEDDDNGIIF